MIAFADELSGIYAVTVTTRAGREVYNEGDADEIRFWLWHFRRAERVAKVDIRELREDEAHGIWSSPGA